MLKAAMSLAFFGFLRVSELTVPAYHTSRQFLARRDIQFLGHQLRVFLTHSKTDQFGQGSVITVGCSEDAVVPSVSCNTTWSAAGLHHQGLCSFSVMVCP